MEPWIDWADSSARVLARRFHLEFDDASQAARLAAWKAFHTWKPGGLDRERFVRTKAFYAIVDLMRERGKGAYGSGVGRIAYANGERFDSVASLDAPVGERFDDAGAVTRLGDLIAFESSHADAVVASCDIRRALSMIPPREAAIVELVDLDGFTLMAVAEALGVSESRISQIRTSAFQHMRPLLAA